MVDNSSSFSNNEITRICIRIRIRIGIFVCVCILGFVYLDFKLNFNLYMEEGGRGKGEEGWARYLMEWNGGWDGGVV